MSGYEKMGTTLIGSGQVTNQNSVTITLTGDAPATTADNVRGIAFWAVTHDLNANAPLGISEADSNARRAQITDSWDHFINPDYVKENGWIGGINAGVYHSIYGSKMYHIIGPKTYMVRTIGAYRLYNPLYAGDQITIAFSNQASTILRLGVNLHTYSGAPNVNSVMSRFNPPGIGIARSNAGAGLTVTPLNYTGPSPAGRFCQLVGACVITDNVADTFTMKTPGLEIDISQMHTIDMDGIHVGYGYQETNQRLVETNTLQAVINVPGSSGTYGCGAFGGGDYWTGATFFSWSSFGDNVSKFYGEFPANPHLQVGFDYQH